MLRKLILKNDVSQLVLLNEFLENTGRDFGLKEERVQELNLVLEEAVSNVIFYAYPEETDQSLEVSMEQRDQDIEVIIRDSGLPFDPTARPDPDVGLAPEDREIGGLGIFLMRRIMSSVEYKRERGENKLIMTMSRD